MKNFERASARTHRLARKMLREGIERDIVVDAFLTESLALWGADGNERSSRFLLKVWAKIRDAADGR